MRRYGGSPAGHNLQSWPVRNNSGETIPPFACMRIVGYYSADDAIGLQVAKPNTFGAQWGHIFNGPRPIPVPVSNGDWGEVSLGPLSLALYDDTSGDPVGGLQEHWGPRNNSWKLHPNTGGFVNHGPAPNAGDDKLCIVQQRPMLTLIGKSEGLTQGIAGNVSIYWSNTDGLAATDTGVDMLAYNRFETVASGKWVALQWMPWGWECVEQDQT